MDFHRFDPHRSLPIVFIFILATLSVQVNLCTTRLIPTQPPDVSNVQVDQELPLPVTTSTCGRSMARIPKIVGGIEAHQGEFPWLVSIRLDNEHFCGGTLLNNEWILTAAHCVAHWMPRQFSVKLGSYYSQNLPEEQAIELPIIRYYVHHYFNVPRPYSNDIALIKIKSVNYTETIWPICLPPNDQNAYENIKGIVAGWGWLNFGYRNRDSSLKVQKVDLPIISNEMCENWFLENRRPFKLSKSQFCAGYAEGGKDACKGDSGGGLFAKRNDRYQVIGIVSAGFGCAGAKMPGLYTRVNSYLDWINQQMSK